MRQSFRFLALLPFITLAFIGLRADEVQVLPTMAVTSAAGLPSVQPTLISLAPAPDPSAGLAEVAHRTAGFAVSDAGARGFGLITSLRGLANTPFFGDSSAPVYLDDIPLASAFTFPTDLFDFHQVAVYRGPQAATLFGRAGDAGVIQLVSTRPGAGTSSHANLSVGNYGLLTLGASVQSASSAHADISAGLSVSQRDGYIQNTMLNLGVDSRKSVSGRVRLNYRPSEGTELSFHVIGQQTRDGAQALVPLGGPLFTVARSKEGASDTDFAAAAVGVTRKLDTGTLSATTSWSKWQLSPYSNRLLVFGGANFDSVVNQAQRTFAEEVRFVSERWSAGAFWSASRTTGGADRVFSGFPIERSSFQTDADSLAVFGRAIFHPAAEWTLAPGLRVERTAKTFTRRETIPANAVLNRNDAWSALLPSVSATRHLDEVTDLTFTVARGFKAGGYSAYTGRADLAGFGPQRSWTLETAYSAAVPASKLTYTARAYASRVAGYQIERSFAVPNSYSDEYLVVNAGKARVLGFELESVWHATREVSVTVAASLCHATLEDFTDPFTGINFSGRRAPYAPTGNGSLRLDYRPAGGVFAGAGLTWTGTTRYDEQETPLFTQRTYTLIEADAGYAFSRGEVRLFGRNLGDRKYYSAITPGVGHGTPGTPLTWGGEVSVRW